MGVSKFVLKLRLCKDEQKSKIFCSSFESASYRIPSNIKLTFRTFTVFSPKTPKNLLSVHFSIIAPTFSSLILFAFAILVLSQIFTSFRLPIVIRLPYIKLPSGQYHRSYGFPHTFFVSGSFSILFSASSLVANNL